MSESKYEKISASVLIKYLDDRTPGVFLKVSNL